MSATYCVIMAGGIGSRFWPMSRTAHPKQFLDILGIGKTLIQLTFDRLTKICPKENILIVTNEAYKDLVLEQLKDIKEDQVLCEPARKNTAPCIAYAAYKIAQKDPNASMVVAPADHLVLREEEFTETIQLALKVANEQNALLTLGIKPSRPDTGYGYIQFMENDVYPDARVRKVKTFTEKPELELAKEFLESGDFYWNSGIFIWNIPTILQAFEKYLSKVSLLFTENQDKLNSPEEKQVIDKIYPLCPNVSIDYGIMEKADNVFVVLSDFGWSDLGTWGSLYNHIEKDDAGNAIIGKNVQVYDTKNCIINMPDKKLVVLQGLKDYIVVDANNILLVCKKEDEQNIKTFVNDIKAQKGDRFL